MKLLSDKKPINKEILKRVKQFLESEGIEGEFYIIKDEDIKNGYTVVIKPKNIKTFNKRIEISHKLNKKGSNLIKGKYLFYLIQPS